MQRIAAVNRGAFLSLGVLFFVSTASAQLLGMSARQSAPGSLKLLAYYQGVQEQKVRFAVRSAGVCATAAPSSLPFPCNTAGDLDAEGDGGAGLVKLVYQPWEVLQYYTAFGVGEYTLKVPSAAGGSTLRGDNPGFTLGGGLHAVIYPDTIVTPGIALDASIFQSNYAFNRSEPKAGSGAVNKVNHALSLRQYQFAVEASKQFFTDETVKLEPYGGLKWVRTEADLLDRQDGSHAGGRLDTVTPFLGVKVPFLDREAFFAEASFVDGYQYAVGLDIRFK